MPLLLIIYQTDSKFYTMKKLLFILLSTFLSSGIYAQANNLQFSQVLNFEYSSPVLSGYGESTVGSLTVPAGKVWKVTSGSCYPSPNNTSGCSIRIGNNVIYLVGYSFNTSVSNTPTWLNTGSYSVIISSLFGSSTAFIGALSIVEFNIVN